MFASSMLALVASASLIGAAPLAAPAMDPPGDPQHIGFIFNPCGSIYFGNFPAGSTIVVTGNTVGTADLLDGWLNVFATVPLYQVIILPDGGGPAIHAEIVVASTTDPIAPGTRIRNVVMNYGGTWGWPQVHSDACDNWQDWAIVDYFTAQGDAD